MNGNGMNETSGAPSNFTKLRGKPFSNSHFFFFVKKRNGIAEMEGIKMYYNSKSINYFY